MLLLPTRYRARAAAAVGPRRAPRAPSAWHRALRSAGLLLLWAWAASQVGCGTTRWSDTFRTATEQLLISNAVDRAVSELDFTSLADREVFFDPSFLKGTVDENYVVSSLRQHLLASGCILRENRDLAEYVVEARSGGLGTDRSDLLFGIPSVSVPNVPGAPVALPSSIPEIPFAKTTNQKAVAKIAVFAYNRKTGRPVMQSGISPVVSTARNSWFLGAGPFQRGTVYEGNHLAGEGQVPIIGSRHRDAGPGNTVPVTASARYPELAAEANTGRDALVQTVPTSEPNAMANGPAARITALPSTGAPVASGTTPAPVQAAITVSSGLKASTTTTVAPTPTNGSTSGMESQTMHASGLPQSTNTGKVFEYLNAAEWFKRNE